jgi:cell shape-determining protein MreD
MQMTTTIKIIGNVLFWVCYLIGVIKDSLVAKILAVGLAAFNLGVLIGSITKRLELENNG